MIKKIFSFLLLFLSTVIFVMCMVSFASIIISSKKNTVPSVFNVSIMSLATKSMEPTYRVGDLVVVRKTDVSKLEVGDVISFYSSDPDIYGMPNTHRIYKIIESEGSPVFVTKGDNNPSEDIYTVDADRVIGKVCFKIPVLGKAITYLQTTKAAYFLVIILPLFVLFAFEMRNVIIKYREGKVTNESEDQ